MSFKNALKNGSGLATFSIDNIREEMLKRERSPNIFPLDVFNPKIKHFINALNEYYDLPRAFIGLTMLSAYSTAIGTAYAVTTNTRDQFSLPVWGALTGISSSGKTLAIGQIFKPLVAIQKKFDEHWEEKTRGLSAEKINYCKLDTVIYRDAHIPTLVKSVLPDNPKGLVKLSDELLEWINGMNQLSKKEGTDEQFWISSWSGQSYSGIRSGKQKFVIHKPFVNIIGGAQYSILHKFFAKDRDTTGFIFRLLFALPDTDKIAEPDTAFEMPAEWYNLHDLSLTRLYEGLPVDGQDSEPNLCVLMPEANKFYQQWVKEKIKTINAIKDKDEMDLHSGILGKIKEYALRFAAILHLADRALAPEYGNDFYTAFKATEYVHTEAITRALKLADYFFASAVEVYNRVQLTQTAPAEVLTCAYLMKSGRNAEIPKALYGNLPDYEKRAESYRVRAWRQRNKWIKEYPKVFNANAR